MIMTNSPSDYLACGCILVVTDDDVVSPHHVFLTLQSGVTGIQDHLGEVNQRVLH